MDGKREKGGEGLRWGCLAGTGVADHVVIGGRWWLGFGGYESVTTLGRIERAGRGVDGGVLVQPTAHE